MRKEGKKQTIEKVEEEKVKEEKEEEERVEEEKVEDLVEKKSNFTHKKRWEKLELGQERSHSCGKGVHHKRLPRGNLLQEAKAIEVVNRSHLREIEEDLYTMTGTRPSRKPKRRPK